MSTVDEDQVALWVRDAREYGLPPMLTGFVLLVPVLGLPYWLALLLLAMLGSFVMLCTAREALGPPRDG